MLGLVLFTLMQTKVAAPKLPTVTNDGKVTVQGHCVVIASGEPCDPPTITTLPARGALITPTVHLSDNGGAMLVVSEGDSRCGGVGTWNNNDKVCTITITIVAPSSVKCSPSAIDDDGTQRMICWYKPKEKP